MKYARKCTATGEGMSEGFVVNDGEKYFKYKSNLIKWLRARNVDPLEELSDDFILAEAYQVGEYYFTKWEDETEFQYIEIDGELREYDHEEEEAKKELLKAWEACDLIKCFELQVEDERTQETDYIIFDISIEGDTLKAQHIALNQEEEDSEKIAFKSIDIDYSYSLDANLQALLEECENAIMESDFYNYNLES